MGARERILALRLLEKQKKSPDIIETLGIYVQTVEKVKNTDLLVKKE